MDFLTIEILLVFANFKTFGENNFIVFDPLFTDCKIVIASANIVMTINIVINGKSSFACNFLIAVYADNFAYASDVCGAAIE